MSIVVSSIPGFEKYAPGTAPPCPPYTVWDEMRMAKARAFYAEYETVARGEAFMCGYGWSIARLKGVYSDIVLEKDADIWARVTADTRELTLYGSDPAIDADVLLNFLKRCEEEFIFQERMKAELEKLK